MRALAITYEVNAGPGVFADAFDGDATLDTWLRTRDAEPPADPFSYDAVMSFGGAMHIDQRDEHPWLDDDQALLARLADRGVPLMGVCLGAQILTRALGGDVRKMERPEVGWFQIDPSPGIGSDPVLGSLSQPFTGFGWHSYECLLPDGATVLARSESCLQAYRHGERSWAIQFHPEVTLPDAESWIDDYRSDDDAVRIGLDPEALRAETREKIDAWNELGRGLARRFVQAAGR